jgi:hypothetical protein
VEQPKGGKRGSQAPEVEGRKTQPRGGAEANTKKEKSLQTRKVMKRYQAKE